MRSAVVVFPGSNCDRDIAVALEQSMGRPAEMIWHKDASLPAGTDLVALPGGFSFGDYLRCGAIAARSPVMQAVIRHAQAGGYVLGICNGFQVLTETGMLPGALMRNANLKFVCRTVHLKVETTESAFTTAYGPGDVLRVPVAHHEGNFVADTQTLDSLEEDDRVAFRYCNQDGSAGGNPNGAMRDIAGLLSANRRVLGMMPHPERMSDPELGGTDGQRLFKGLLNALVAA